MQIRKISIFKNLFIKNNTRKRFNNEIRSNIFIESKVKSYEITKKKLRFIFLVLHDRIRQLYIDVNISHKRF